MNNWGLIWLTVICSIKLTMNEKKNTNCLTCSLLIMTLQLQQFQFRIRIQKSTDCLTCSLLTACESSRLHNAGCFFVNNFVVNFQIEAPGKLQVSLHMLKVERNFKTLRTLSSTSWHLTSTMLRCFEILADRSIRLKLPFISILYLGPCSEINHFSQDHSAV